MIEDNYKCDKHLPFKGWSDYLESDECEFDEFCLECFEDWIYSMENIDYTFENDYEEQ